MELKVGDRIYRIEYGAVRSVITIERVTKTMAISGNYRFKLECGGFGVSVIGGSIWPGYTYHLETDELKAKLEKGEVYEKVKNYNFSKLTIDQLKRIINILNETK